MLTVSPEQVCFIIAKARVLDEKMPPSEQDSEDDGRIVLEDYRDDPTYAELVAAIRSLNIDARLDLVALMWMGRGDYDAEEFSQARREARESGGKDTAAYLLGTPLLGDYLEEALTGLGYNCEDFEGGRL